MLRLLLAVALISCQARASLSFSSAADQYVNFGSGSALDNMNTATTLVWLYPTDVTLGDQAVMIKAEVVGFTAYRSVYIGNTGGLNGTVYADVKRTSDLLVRSAASTLSSNSWQVISVCWNTGGVNADQQIFVGNLTTPMAEVTYSTQAVGSGTPGDDAAQSLAVGNASPTSPQSWSRYAGRIALVMRWNRVLPLGELRQQQFRPHVTSGLKLFSVLGWNGTGTQADWSGCTDTGCPNQGTVTGATVADHVPLGGLLSFFRMPDLWLRFEDLAMDFILRRAVKEFGR